MSRSPRRFAAWIICALLGASVTPVIARQQAPPPRNWHLLDDSLDKVPGISADRAFRELLAGKSPQREVIVAVIDGGLDTAHAAFRGLVWSNAREVAGNHGDDDGNGYADDIHGWNYLGARDGRNYQNDMLEEDRVLVSCRREAAKGAADRRSTADKAACGALTRARAAKRDSLTRFSTYVIATQDTLLRYTKMLRAAAGTDSLTREKVVALTLTEPRLVEARRWWIALGVFGAPEPLIAEDRKVLNEQMLAFEGVEDPRALVGDNPEKYDEVGYGNPDVRGPEPSHGTHVAGVIAGIADSGTGGVARSHVKLMILRTVPNGDERDKDVANAIRYAVDNGAAIINMSFGKRLSPGKAAVDAAVAYAEKKGVLMVHAAGNDALEITPSLQPFPTPQYLKGGMAGAWIEVGASSWQKAGLAASFSNYGKLRVDVFAPGDEVLSARPGGGYERGSGTSTAAPVVSGIAAVLMSYFPALTAADVKRLILASVTPYPTLEVLRPGDGTAPPGKVAFGELSRTGGVVNLYRAIQQAEQEAKKP